MDVTLRRMVYSIHDAIEIGWNHVVFITQKDIEKGCRKIIGNCITTRENYLS